MLWVCLLESLWNISSSNKNAKWSQRRFNKARGLPSGCYYCAVFLQPSTLMLLSPMMLDHASGLCHSVEAKNVRPCYKIRHKTWTTSLILYPPADLWFDPHSPNQQPSGKAACWNRARFVCFTHKVITCGSGSDKELHSLNCGSPSSTEWYLSPESGNELYGMFTPALATCVQAATSIEKSM